MLEIRVLEGDGAVRPPGARTAGFTVRVTDELGRPVEGAIVSFRLPDDGPGGAFASGLASDIVTTGSNGEATTSPVRWSRAGGSFQVRVTAVKGPARAGTIITQQISEEAAAAAPSTGRRSVKKWVVIGILAGAAAAGYAAGKAGGADSPAQAASAVEIGAPAITIGKP
jgi:hypothetical protein